MERGTGCTCKHTICICMYMHSIRSIPLCLRVDPFSNLMTSCDHSFCKDCIAEYCNRQSVEINEIPCPYCRQIDMKFYDIKLGQEE